MKKFLFYLISILLCSSGITACETEDNFVQEKEIIISADTTLVVDTIINSDTTFTADTIIRPDTIIQEIDTVIKMDTIIINDTIIKNDTVINNNTVISQDTILLSYEKYMDLRPSYGTVQGAACYGKYLFQGYSNNAALGVYDLEKKTVLCKLEIPGPKPSSNTHANTVNFGYERLSPDDYFPLLYISSGYTKNINGSPCSFIYVYRISKYPNSEGSEGFHIEFVQTITLMGFGSWTEGIPDNDHNLLWIKYEPNSTNGEYRYASFAMPKLENGDVTIIKDNALTDFSLGTQPFISSNQGHLYYDNKILLVSGGSSTTQKKAFIVINTITQTRELVIDLGEIGLNFEPENLFFYNNHMMIGYSYAIYKFNLYPISK